MSAKSIKEIHQRLILQNAQSGSNWDIEAADQRRSDRIDCKYSSSSLKRPRHKGDPTPEPDNTQQSVVSFRRPGRRKYYILAG